MRAVDCQREGDFIRNFILLGAVAGALVMSFSVGYTIVSPMDGPRESSSSIFYWTVDRVLIPAEAYDPATWPRARIQGGLVATYIAAVAAGLLAGAILGCTVWLAMRVVKPSSGKALPT